MICPKFPQLLHRDASKTAQILWFQNPRFPTQLVQKGTLGLLGEKTQSPSATLFPGVGEVFRSMFSKSGSTKRALGVLSLYVCRVIGRPPSARRRAGAGGNVFAVKHTLPSPLVIPSWDRGPIRWP